MLPLSNDARQEGGLKADAHRGLWWSRFFNKYGVDFSKPDVGGARDFIGEICKARCGGDEVLNHIAMRQADLVAKLGGEHVRFQTRGRFVIGMGNDHPTENGFTWHPTLGVPYLPASSVKGLVRGWLEWQWGQEALQKNGDAQKRRQLLQWFGSEHKESEHQVANQQAGWFIFFDALPTEPVTLGADVMTPHYGKWYEQVDDEKKYIQADTVPADWHSPVPVTFLTVKKATFQFGVAVRAGLKDGEKNAAQAALPQVMAILGEALEWAGAGAKTATGYGRMGPAFSDSSKSKPVESTLECKVLYNAGKGILTVLVDGKLVECKRDASDGFMKNCPEENKMRWKKDKPVLAKIKLLAEGNNKVVEELEWLPPGQ